jgi:hypothetical protein
MKLINSGFSHELSKILFVVPCVTKNKELTQCYTEKKLRDQQVVLKQYPVTQFPGN